MNKRMTAHIVGLLLLAEAALLLLPALVSVLYGEWSGLKAFLLSALLVAAVGFGLTRIPVKRRTIFSKEGLAAVALGWIVLSIGGCLPFYFSGAIPHFIDALFETVSGLTTTGSSILTDVEALSHGMLFWRSFTHWVGGMGVLVFVMIAAPMASGGGNIHLMRAESPGHDVSKLVPSARGTAKWLYGIYIVMTLAEMVILFLLGNDLFTSVTMAFGTAGTGGFGILNSSAADYTAATQVVITIFMTAFGINFGVYYLLIKGKWKEALHNEEVWVYLGLFTAAALIIALNVRSLYGGMGESLRHAFFQVSSVMTTTGFATTDFNLWPELSRMTLLLAMCIGACAGSTGGGFKISRLVILWKEGRRQIKRAVTPNRVEMVHFNGKPLSQSILSGVCGYLVLYVILIAVSIFLISFDRMDITTNVTAVLATVNNIGPGLSVVGPTGNFSGFSVFSKCVLIFDMLAGRLEIIPVFALFARRTWRS